MDKTLSFVLVIIIIAVVLGGFYWFAWRPDQIRKMCAQQANTTILFPNAAYNDCLRANGLDK